MALAVLGCTGQDLGGGASGWSPAAAVAVPLDTGSKINEGRTFSSLDDVLTVTIGTPFVVGQTLLIDDERLEITSIRDRDLRVARGIGGTDPQDHANGSAIYALGDEYLVVISTKQGIIKALLDDGSDAPPVEWSFTPSGREQ